MRQRGFTLVEVMVSLAILAVALVVLISVTAADVREAQRAQLLNVASMLARGKIYDLEEELMREGFQPNDQQLDGNFGDEGWEQFTWRADIRVVELPNLTNVAGDSAEGGEADPSASNPLAGMLSSFGLGGDIGGAESAGAGLIASQFQTIQQVLKESMRKITLRVEWVGFGPDNCTRSRRQRIRECMEKKGGCDDDDLNRDSIRCEELVVDYYITEPAAISRVMGGAAAAGGSAGSSSTSSGTTGGSGAGTGSGGTSSGTTGRTGTTPTTGRAR
ncbi:MAG: type II secretion system GspH family protein [Deltaproteobacteria bacterium]|nr:type II secretion system GspH family protein [Deltaproteobacteria bacterium]